MEDLSGKIIASRVIHFVLFVVFTLIMSALISMLVIYITYRITPGVTSNNSVLLAHSADSAGEFLSGGFLATFVMPIIYAFKKMWRRKASDAAKWHLKWFAVFVVVFYILILNHDNKESPKKDSAVSIDETLLDQKYLCSDFNSIGPAASSGLDLLDMRPTEKQATIFKYHLSDIIDIVNSSSNTERKSALKLITQNGLIPKFTGETFHMTRAFCYEKRTESFDIVIAENFTALLDAVAKKTAQQKAEADFWKQDLMQIGK